MQGLVSGLCSIALVYMTVFMTLPHCFDDCSFVVSFEIRKCESSNFVFLFHDCFDYSVSLAFPYGFLGFAWQFLQKKKGGALGVLITVVLNL